MDYFDTRENHWISSALHKTPRRAAFKSRSSTQSEEIRRVLPRGRASSFLFINPALLSVHLPPNHLHLWKYESNHNVDGHSGIGSCTKEWWKASGTRRDKKGNMRWKELRRTVWCGTTIWPCCISPWKHWKLRWRRLVLLKHGKESYWKKLQSATNSSVNFSKNYSERNEITMLKNRI